MGDFSSYNNGEAELPHSVQQLIIQICKKERKDPPDDEARGLLLALGEERSLWILKEIWKYQIKKTLSAFIVFMARKYYPSETQQFYRKQNYEESVPSAESFYHSPQYAKTSVSSSMKEQQQLEQVCVGLSSRLQEYKYENAQLEELLVAERELSKSCEARIEQLQEDLSAAKKEVSRVASSMAEALAAKNAEIEALVSSMDALKKQAALSEGNLASLQASMDSLMRNRELAETRMMQALKEELGAAERRSEEERAAHKAAREAFMEREEELEHRALEASTALARAQRTADERTAKATELEQKLALLEVECATLNHELQDMQARTRRGQKKPSEEANQVLQVLNMQMQAWQEEMERVHQGQREAESKHASLEAEMQKLRVETTAMKRDAERYSRQQVSGSLEGTAAGETKSDGIGLDTFQRDVQRKQKREIWTGARCWGALLARCPRHQITEEQIGRTTGAPHPEAFS